jgi:alkylated DNA repair dioxygenase AlkB
MRCGSGVHHGDTERTRVICLSIGGRAYPLRWQWFHRNKAVGAPFDVTLESGDVYVMSEKAVGQDWKRSSLFTLRHAAGAAKFRAIRAGWK